MAVSAFTDQQISSWAQTFEKEIAAKHDLIVDRWSLGIIDKSNEYELPNYVTNIRSVLYLGKECHAKGFRSSVITGDTPFQTSGSIPFEYVFSGKGQRVLKLYPTPNTNIAVYNGDLWTADADRYGVIIEFYRIPDFTGNNPSLTLPSWCRQYLLKDMICEKAFRMEGPTQDLRAAKYYQGRIDKMFEYVMKIKSNMNAAQMRVLFDNKMLARRKPGRPVLPPNFGFPVNW